MSGHDVLVIGAGVAGLTAALHAARFGLDVIVVDRMGVGGQILTADRIENFPGSAATISGIELGPLLLEQAEAAGAQFALDTVETVDPTEGAFLARGAEESWQARTLIIAAGSTLRGLGIPGEDRLAGKGISHCASCDGPLYKGQTVCVAGGGDSGADEALLLAQHAAKVIIIESGPALTAQKATADRIRATRSIEVLAGTTIEAIEGIDAVASVRLRDAASAGTRSLETRAVFVCIGLIPNTAFLGGLVALDAAGRIETDIMMRTSRAGVFAAGDIRGGSVALLAAAAGDGATAAVSAVRYLRGS